MPILLPFKPTDHLVSTSGWLGIQLAPLLNPSNPHERMDPPVHMSQYHLLALLESRTKYRMWESDNHRSFCIWRWKQNWPTNYIDIILTNEMCPLYVNSALTHYPPCLWWPTKEAGPTNPHGRKSIVLSESLTKEKMWESFSQSKCQLN